MLGRNNVSTEVESFYLSSSSIRINSGLKAKDRFPIRHNRALYLDQNKILKACDI